MATGRVNDLESLADAVIETVDLPILVLDGDMRVQRANSAFYSQFRVDPEETLGRLVYQLGNGQWDIPELRVLLQEILPRDRVVRNYRVAHEFELIGRRIMELNARCIAGDGGADCILMTVLDITERVRLQHELEGRIEFADKLIDSVREGLLILTWDLKVVRANQSFYDTFRVDRAETEGRLVYELGNGQWNIPRLRELLEEILPRESTFDDFEVEHDFERIGRRIMVLNARRLDHLNLIVLAIRDRTEARRAAAQTRTTLGELQHRVKNMLNVVNALSVQTRRRSQTLEEYAHTFENGLASLARLQDLLVNGPEGKALLDRILELELEANGASKGVQFTLDGPDVYLTPTQAQNFAMAVHELTTNAIKYGALSTEGAWIQIEWTTEMTAGIEKLRFRWKEHGVRIEEPPSRTGFGTQIIEQALPYMLGGESSFALHHDGAECRLEFPLE